MNNTGKFSEYVLKDLKTDEDIKEWINIGFEEFLLDNDLNALVKALEYAVRAKDSILGMSKRRAFQEVIFTQYLMANNSRSFLLR